MKQKIVVALSISLSIMAAFLIISSTNHNEKLFSSKNEVPEFIDDIWKHWQMEFGKKYETKSEHDFRLNAFYESFKQIENHKKKVGMTFEMALNQFADLTAEEFKNKYLGLNELNEKFLKKFQQNNTVKLPINHEEIREGNIDWVKEGAVTEVKNQGECGSCWAFSVTGACEGQNFVKNKKLESFSEQQLVDCNTSWIPFKGNGGCRGGQMVLGFKYVAYYGVMGENEYPYEARQGWCRYPSKNKNNLFFISSYINVPTDDNDQLVQAIHQQPITVGINGDGIKLYSSGVFNDWKDCGWTINHGVLAVGYGKEGDQLFYKVKNSWGPLFGENGYIRLERKEGYGQGICSITQMASYPVLN